MSIAYKNVPLTIHRPGVNGVTEVTFAKLAAEGDFFRIPRRYPFADIKNYAALVTAKFFRHTTTTVSSELGGSSTTNTEGVLGFELPNTEKLILLIRRTGVATTGTAKHKFTIHGSAKYGGNDVSVEWAADETFTSGTKIYELDIFNLGLFIEPTEGVDGVLIELTDDEATPALEFALVARMG